MTTTTNYDLELPAPGNRNWGTKVNNNFTVIDAQLKATADALVDEIEARALAVQEAVAAGAENAEAVALEVVGSVQPGSDTWLRAVALCQGFLLNSSPPTYDDVTGTLVNSNIKWPDLKDGVYTATLDDDGAVTSFTATYLANETTIKTVTVTVPRNSASVINAPMTAVVS